MRKFCEFISGSGLAISVFCLLANAFTLSNALTPYMVVGALMMACGIAFCPED